MQTLPALTVMRYAKSSGSWHAMFHITPQWAIETVVYTDRKDEVDEAVLTALAHDVMQACLAQANMILSPQDIQLVL